MQSPSVFLLALCSLLAPTQSAAAPTQDAELLAALTSAVDQDDPTQRAAAATALVARKVQVADWLRIMEGFGSFEAAEKGSQVVLAELWADGSMEAVEMHVYVPRSYDPAQRAPLMLSFHGTGGTGRGMDTMWRGVAEQLGMIVVAPGEAGANVGFAWTQRELDAALSAMRWARRHFNIDEGRIFASGVSRGGHLAWDLALRYPGTFAAIAPMIGSPRISVQRAQNNTRYLENVLELPIRDLQGARDQKNMLFSLRETFKYLEKKGAKDAQLIEFEELGHSFDFSAVDWKEFLGGARRVPTPALVLRRAAREGEGRAHYLEVLDYDKLVEEEFVFRVKTTRGKKLDNFQLLSELMKQADKKTARIEVRYREPGRFSVKAKGVKRFRLLLTPEMLDAKGGVEVAWGSRRTKRKPKPNSELLIREFVERFDRDFLPVAEVEAKR